MRRLAIMLAIIMATVAVVFARNDWMSPPAAFAPGFMPIDTLPAMHKQADIHVRAMPATTKPCSWQLMWCYVDTVNYVYARLDYPDSQYSDNVYQPTITLTVGEVVDGADNVLHEQQMAANFDMVSLKVVYDGYAARLYTGQKVQEYVCEVPYDASQPMVAAISTSGKVKCNRLTAMSMPHQPLLMTPWTSIDELSEYLAESTDKNETMWEYLDRDVDTDKAELRAKYVLATISDGEGGYDIIYLDGSTSENWQPFTLKGHLKPTIFIDNYDLEWMSESGIELSEDCNAQIGAGGAILELRFPLLNSKLRLRRLKTASLKTEDRFAKD